MITAAGQVLVYWLPLGAGGHVVRVNGRLYERWTAHREHRPPADLYHCGLEVVVGPERYVIEMAPVWSLHDADRGVAVDSPVAVDTDVSRARRLLELVPQAPRLTWGRDELHAGDMWNSNSLVSWLLVRSGHDITTLHPPANGRAPGWQAGLVLAVRQQSLPDPVR
jgi:hypothetical protein